MEGLVCLTFQYHLPLAGSSIVTFDRDETYD
jgi:hypothetical protein